MPGSLRSPWRSVWLPRAVTAVALAVGLPLFLRMPPWCDITLYQLAARNILHGGVHYRDLFDTNLPGFVWAMTALYWLFGPNVIAVRVLDLLVVFGVVALLDRLAKWGGATPASRWWALAGAALFYPFTVEMSHAQRDTWMALPALAAVALRVRRGMGGGATQPAASPFRASFCEGVLWGAGVWMKPHIALMALGVWLLTVRRLAGEHPRPWRAAALDLLGNLLGGVAIAIPGILWMTSTGVWDAFYDVFTEWNPRYVKLAQKEFQWRLSQELYWFPVWSLGLVLTVPLAVASVIDSAFWLSRRAAGSPGGDAPADPDLWHIPNWAPGDASEPGQRGPLGRWLPGWLWDTPRAAEIAPASEARHAGQTVAGADARFVRGVLGGLYLVWAAQAFFIQRGFQYAHVPETLLMIGLWASHRWAWVPMVLTWLALTSTLWIVADCWPGLECQLKRIDAEARQRFLPRHVITQGSRLKLWPQCWRLEMPDKERYALWDKLRLHPPHEASIGWVELAEVADFLRNEKHVKDGEVVAWFDSPHAVYLMLDTKPGFRFMHVYTAIAISVSEDTSGELGRKWVLDELRATNPWPKYAISDLEWVALSASDDAQRARFVAPAESPDHLLPPGMPYQDEFPFNQPTVFRTRNGTGRYVVHRIVNPADTRAPAPANGP